jgi:hypothetical protein
MFASGIHALVLGGALFAATNVQAVKDDEYYRAGMGNPNVDLKMYWADAHNVLEDLDQFSSLYIQYHNCAWSQNRNQYNYDEEEESGSGDETDYWYIDATPQYTANVAYSLYGSLTGESFSGCNENTFINSFTTNSGFESFASAIYYAGSSSTDYSGTYSSECQGGAGVACDYQVGFATVSYSTNNCDPYYSTGVTDSMGYMNSAFQSAQCVKIYDGNSNNYNNNNNNNNGNNYNNGNNRDLKQQQNNEEVDSPESSKNYNNNGDGSNNKEGDSESNNEDRNLQNNYGYGGYGYNGYNSYNNYYNYAGTALSVLYYSNACFVQNFWAPNGGCPDPFGKLQLYQQNFNKGVRKSMKVDTYVTYRANMAVGKKYVKIGALFFMAAALLFAFEQLMAHRSRKEDKRLGIKTKSSKKKGAVDDRDSKNPKKRSVVGLVRSATGKLKDVANKTVARAAKANKCSGEEDNFDEKDGVMVDDIKASSKSKKGKGTTSKKSSYKAPPTLSSVKEASSEDSIVKVEMPATEKR